MAQTGVIEQGCVQCESVCVVCAAWLILNAFMFCACACVCEPGRWPLLAEPLSEDVSEYRGPLLIDGLSLCFPHLRVHTDLHRLPLHSALARHSVPITLGLSSCRNTGVSPLFSAQIRVQAKRKNGRGSEGCVEGGNGIWIIDACLSKKKKKNGKRKNTHNNWVFEQGYIPGGGIRGYDNDRPFVSADALSVLTREEDVSVCISC